MPVHIALINISAKPVCQNLGQYDQHTMAANDKKRNGLEKAKRQETVDNNVKTERSKRGNNE